MSYATRLTVSSHPFSFSFLFAGAVPVAVFRGGGQPRGGRGQGLLGVARRQRQTQSVRPPWLALLCGLMSLLVACRARALRICATRAPHVQCQPVSHAPSHRNEAGNAWRRQRGNHCSFFVDANINSNIDIDINIFSNPCTESKWLNSNESA